MDPLQLLDPKSFHKSEANLKKRARRESPGSREQTPLPLRLSPPPANFVFDSAASNGQYEDDEDEEISMGTMIEKAHNITRREERPSKKLKVDEGSNFAHKFVGGKGGEISEYIRAVRQDGAEFQPPGMSDDGSEFKEGAKGLNDAVKDDLPQESSTTEMGDKPTEVVDLTGGRVFSKFRVLNKLTQ